MLHKLESRQLYGPIDISVGHITKQIAREGEETTKVTRAVFNDKLCEITTTVRNHPLNGPADIDASCTITDATGTFNGTISTTLTPGTAHEFKYDLGPGFAGIELFHRPSARKRITR
jgi:hypothetical protein